MSWVLHSMQPNIVWGYMVLQMVQEIWSAASQTFLQLGNNVQVYELVKKVHETKPRERILVEYHTDLRAPWQENHHREDFQVDCVSDTKKHN